jgi:hypothetical protein
VKSLSFVALAIPFFIASPARAQAPVEEAPSPSPEIRHPVDRREGDWRVELGYRGWFIPTSGYQAFSNNGYLPEFSVAASRTVFSLDRLSLAAGLAWDIGGSGSAIRQVDQSSLKMQRFAVTLEGRLHLGSWGYAFARVAPGAATERVEVDDASSSAPLEASAWLFTGDVSAGYAWLLWPRDAASKLEPRAWLQAEGGYGWVAGEKLALEPAVAPGASVPTSGVDLGTLAMQGGFFRVAVAMTF